MGWIRARSEEQVEQRINEIVDATARLYAGMRFEEMTFAMIGKEANFTRSNLYHYFRNKEEIFLELLQHGIMQWRNDILLGTQNDRVRSKHYDFFLSACSCINLNKKDAGCCGELDPLFN